jgi:hypothetical protein
MARPRRGKRVYTVISDVDPGLLSSYGWAGNPIGPWIVGYYTTREAAEKARHGAYKALHENYYIAHHPDEWDNGEDMEEGDDPLALNVPRVWIEEGRLNEGDVNIKE